MSLGQTAPTAGSRCADRSWKDSRDEYAYDLVTVGSSKTMQRLRARMVVKSGII